MTKEEQETQFRVVALLDATINNILTLYPSKNIFSIFSVVLQIDADGVETSSPIFVSKNAEMTPTLQKKFLRHILNRYFENLPEIALELFDEYRQKQSFQPKEN